MNQPDLIKMIRREVCRALRPTGLIGARGPALNIKCLVVKEVKLESKNLIRLGRLGCQALGLTENAESESWKTKREHGE